MILPLFAGGVVGTALRVAGFIAYPPATGGVPWVTLAENLSGALALGLLTPFLLQDRRHDRRGLFWATGVLGSYTTFSAMALEGAALLATGAFSAALIYLGLSLLVGPPLALAGLATGDRLLRDRNRGAA